MDGHAMPEGRWLAMVRIGPESQIVIPQEVCDIFALTPGDSLLMLADRDRGIALVNPDEYSDLMDEVMGTAPFEPPTVKELRAGRKPPPSITQRVPAREGSEPRDEGEQGR